MPKFIILHDYTYTDGSIPPLARILFAQISSLAKNDGYCHASNKYLSEINNVDERTIRRLLNQLESSNYIDIVIDKKQPNNLRRKIYINDIKGQNCPIGTDN
ncbi:MAG TPA: helix-turn-helix domain-containing protein [Candidatus Faecimonas gallistercoris]|nr:helix-turn-helix domain-containing protein [Candidatus Faecimonas gallistercoris]